MASPPFTVSSPLSPFLDPLPVLRSKNHPFFPRPITHFVASTLVFNPSGQLLIVQRSPTDVGAHLWEIPGGSVDAHESLLEAAARELFEEAGLRMVSAECAVGPRAVGEVGTVAVSEVTVSGERYDARAGHVFEDGNPAKKDWLWCRMSFVVGVEGWENVVLDEREHQAFLWVGEEEVRGRAVDGRELVFVSEEMRAIMLEGFRVRRDGDVRG